MKLNNMNFIQQYLRKRKYRKILTEIDALYADINPFHLVKSANLASHNPDDFHYGEINLCAILDLLAIVRPQANDIFYDLGSGDGKVAFATKLGYPTLKVKGVELLPELFNVSNKILSDYLAQYSLRYEDFDVKFINDNFLSYPFIDDATIIFINATSYLGETWEQILLKLLTLKSKTKVIISSKVLPESHFIKHYQGMEHMSWGLTSTYIYEKK